ncbi:MAG: FecR family protein [Gemmatimonadaceae bacterium]
MTTDLTSVIHDPADDETWERLARHLTGESPPEESRALAAWVSEAPERAHLLESSARAFDAARAGMAGVAGAPDPRASADAAWPAVESRLDAEAAPAGGRVVRPAFRAASPYRSGRTRALGYALAAAATLVVLGGSYVLLRPRAQRSPVAAAPAAPRVPREYATRPGQRSVVDLVDGTRVTLGPGSILRLRAGLGGDSAAAGAREVTLEGEAFFAVRHDERRPFVVRGAAGVVRDLGTSFSVRSYGVERSLRVAVTEGRVSLRAAAAGPDTLGVPDSLLLRAGEVAEVTPGGLPARLPKGAAASLLAWTRDTLVFSDAPLSRVAVEIERWYAVRVAIPDSALAHERLTAVVPRDSLARMLEVVGLALGVTPVQVGNRVVLRRP